MMKTYILFLMIALLSVSCNSQTNKNEETNESKEAIIEQPKGNWKVDKEFDEHGNLIRYDSVYSWSSNGKLDNFTSLDKDSILRSFKSKFFTSFSSFKNEDSDTFFTEDSLFSDQFFKDDFFNSSFGKDFMAIDKIRKQMLERQKKFLEKKQSDFIKPNKRV